VHATCPRPPRPPQVPTLASRLQQSGNDTSVACPLRLAQPRLACCPGVCASSGSVRRSTGAEVLRGGESAYLKMQIRSSGSCGSHPQCSPASLEGGAPAPTPCRGSLAGSAPEALPSREREGTRRERCVAVPLRRPAQRGGLSALSRRLPRLLSPRLCIRRRGERELYSNSACGTPHDRSLIPGAKRRLSESAQVGWRLSPRLAAIGAPGSGENPTVRFAPPRLCIPPVVDGPQVLSGPHKRGDGPTNAVCGPW